MLLFFLIGGIFVGIMIPTMVGSITPKLSIKILEAFKVYKKGTLISDTRNMIDGGGFHKTGKVFLFSDKNVFERFETARVLGYLLLIFVPICLATSCMIYVIIGI